MEKLFNIPIELFELDKVVINKVKACKVNYTITDNRGDKNDVFYGAIEPNYQSTESLQAKLNELKPFLCKICHIAENKQNSVNVTGVEMSGQGETATFKIHGVQLSESEQAMRFSTCKVQYEGSYYGFEVDVANIIEDLTILTHGYVFEGKKAVITLGLNSVEDEEEFDDHEEIEEDNESENE